MNAAEKKIRSVYELSIVRANGTPFSFHFVQVGAFISDFFFAMLIILIPLPN